MSAQCCSVRESKPPSGQVHTDRRVAWTSAFTRAWRYAGTYLSICIQCRQVAGLEVAAAQMHLAIGEHGAPVNKLPHDPSPLAGQTIDCTLETPRRSARDTQQHAVIARILGLGGSYVSFMAYWPRQNAAFKLTTLIHKDSTQNVDSAGCSVSRMLCAN